MTKLKISLISVLVNAFLALGKIIAGFFSASIALIADGIHSGLDVLSSLITYFGIKIASKKADEKHPYGHHTAETLAGLAVALLLAVSGVWIAYEGLDGVLGRKTVDLNIFGFIIAFASILINEIMARYKFKIGSEENSLALIADGQHSRADAISSIGVLLGLFLVKFIPMIDALIAIIIGFYIIYESWDVGKETIDQLIGVSDEELENEIKNILKKQGVLLSKIKTRKIGSASFAEITIQLKSDLKINEAQEISKNLEELLLKSIERLQHIVISVESHDYEQCFVRTKLGQKIKWRRKHIKETKPKEKNIYRIIMPIDKENKTISKDLGAPHYLLIDKKDNKTVNKKIVKNPYYEKNFGHGMRFAKAVKADEIITTHIGDKAKKLAQELNIKINKVAEDFDYEKYNF